MKSTLAHLAEPIPERFVQQKPGSDADFVKHSIVAEFLIGKTRRIPRQTVVREIYDGEKLTGCVLRLEVFVDGEWTWVEEAGDSDNPQSKTNGARLMDAISSAYKRCAMRHGCGLSLWVGDSYFLHESLARSEAKVGPREQLIETLQYLYPPELLNRKCAENNVTGLDALSPRELQKIAGELAKAVADANG